MRHLNPRILFIPLLVLLIAPAAYSVDVQRMDEVVSYYSDKQEFMGSVLVAKGEDRLFSKSYGLANAEWDIPNTATTKFRLGSITKQFTAVAILQLQEAGKLKTSDRIGQYIPDTPEAWQDITIFHLLTHSAGLFNVTALPDFNDHSIKPMKAQEVLELVMDKSLDFEPGEEMRYSNSGYIALGVIIEAVTNQSYADYLQENIFNPLGMKDSGFDSNSDVIPNRAAGYTLNNGKLVNASYVHMSVPHAAGALYSTVEDLSRWNKGLYGGKLISRESLEMMTTGYKNNYALGIAVEESRAGPTYSHGGGIQGFNTFLSYYPDSKVTVVALANVNGIAPTTISSLLGALAHGQDVTLPNERQEIELTSNDLQRLVGTYEGPSPGLTFKVTLNGKQLFTQMSGQRQLPIFPESELTFFAKEVNAQIEFVEADGKISELVLKQGGRNIRWPKISDEVAVRKAISLSDEQLKRYTGIYPIGGGMELSIKLENSKLSGQVTGRPPFDLAPESETRVFSKTVDLYIDFSKDNADNIIGMTMHVGPTSFEGKKQ